ncbi:hypothetical protein AB9F27_00010 [Falsihalocynthiibacter sp. CO-5D18]
MNIREINQHARALYSAHGDKAEHEAAQRELKSTETGAENEAEDWRRVRLSIRQIRGPNES